MAEKSIDAAILIIIVVVIAAAAAIGGYYLGTRSGGGAGENHGIPPNASLSLVSAEKTFPGTVKITISYEFNPNVPRTDIQIQATNSPTGGMAVISGSEIIGVGPTLTDVGSTLSIGVGSVSYAYLSVNSGDTITVVIIYVPSHQILGGWSVVVQ